MFRLKYYLAGLVGFSMLTLWPDGSFAQERYEEKAWSRINLKPGPVTEVRDNPVVYSSSIIKIGSLPPQDSPDVQITTATNTTQSENSVAVSPLNDNLLLNSNNSSNFPVTTIFGASGFTSTDGGLTWTGSTGGTGGTNQGDPASAIALTGRFHNGYIANSGNGAAWSTNNGTTWTHVQVAPNPGSLADKNHLAVDISPTSPFANNVYASWTDFGGANNNRIVFSRSTDQGLTWSPRVNISAAVGGTSHDQGVNIATGPNGEVYLMWAVYDGTFPVLETALGFAKSTDGGATFATPVRVITNIKGIRSQASGGGLLGGKDMRTASFPSMAVNLQNGHLYVVWANIGVPGVNTGTERDVYLSKSTDGGTTWSTAVRVNQDTFNNGKDQWFPWISCDPVTGTLSIIFYDSRDFAANEQANTYVAISRDAGSTFEDFKVSDASWSGDGSGTGFSSNYAGDYIGITSRNGKVYPVWTDRREAGARLSTWVSPFSLADPEDPNPPTNVSAYSDFTTPTSIALKWTKPTTLANGDPIGPYVMRIKRDGVQITEVTPPDSTYTDTGRTTYQQYTYTLETRLTANDSLSSPVDVTWTAGGSPFPGTPTGFMVTASEPGRTTQANLSWTNPTTQKDGTPIHDLGGTIIFRNGVAIDSVTAANTTYVDMPPQGFTYCYTLRAYNTLTPRRYSDPTAPGCVYVGDVPDFLVWQPPDAISPSGDSLSASLTRLGKSNLLRDSLFAFGPNLSQYEGIFVCLGIYSNNHVLGASDPEGAALESYIQGGGKVYLEGGDCFNYDPESASGYQIRPWFGLNDGADGGADVTSVAGRGFLNGLTFAYTGGNNFMDELHPSSGGGARVLYTIPGSTPANDTSAVYNFFGSGRTVGAVPEFGGLVDDATNKKDSVLSKILQFFAQPVSPPEIDITPLSLADTLQQGATHTKTFNIANTTLPPSDPLFVDISESVTWLTVSPTSDTLNGGENVNVNVNFDATGLTIGTYNTNVVVTSNDPNEPTTNVAVTLVVTGSPTITTRPDSLVRTQAPNTTGVDTLTIKNTGLGPLNWSMSDIPAGPNGPSVPQPQADELYPPRLGRDGWPMAVGKNDETFHHGPPVTDGQGGPDSAGYRWIDSDEPGGPTFNWFDITGVGTQITTWTSGTGDDGSVVLPLPFSFEFYGGTYSQIKVCTNGWTGFQVGVTTNAFSNVAIPSTAQPNLTLFGFWDDLDVRTQGTVHYYDDAANSRFIVQYTNVPHYAPSGTGTYTFQMIVKQDGVIMYQYLDMQGLITDATIGIENGSGTVGLQVVFNSTYMHNNLAIQIAKDAPWLSESPTSGTVQPGDSTKVAVTFNSTGLTDGVYRANLIIANNDLANNPKIVPVRLTVAMPPPAEALADHITSAFRASVTNEGNIGYLNAFPPAGPGRGFQFNPISASGQRLFEGSIMIGLDSVRVSDAARNNASPEQLDADFQFLANLDSSQSSGFTRITRTAYSDVLAETPFGVRVDQRSVSWDSAGLNSFLIMELDLQNTTASPYSGLAVGGYFDWDVNPSTAQDRGQVIVDSTNTIPGVNGGNPFLFEMMELHQGVSPTAWVGVVPLNENKFFGRRVAIQSTEIYPPHMTNGDKWRYMTTNRPTNPNGDAGSNVDHGQVFGLGPYNINAGATRRVGFALVAGNSLQAVVNAARAAQRAWVQRLGNSINVVTGVDESFTGIPETFVLGQNYPNPFNPTTVIEFGLPEQSEVSLRIYNVLGQEVRTLLSGTQGAGHLKAEWDGRNAFGGQVSSGVYFYRLEATGASGSAFSSMKKMLLLK